MRTRTKRDLCNGPLLSNMFFYALPVAATGILQVLYNAADMVAIGAFRGDDSLAAISSTGSLSGLIVNLFLGLSSGVLAVVARHIGAQHHKRVRQSVHTSMLLALVSGIILTIIGVLIAGPVLKLMGTGAATEGSTVLEKATLYMRIYFLGMPGFLVYNFGASILRAAGDTKRPMLYLMFSGLLNVVLNLFFVIVCHMDVEGVAIATIASQYLSAVLVVLCLMREKGDIRLELKRLRIYPKRLAEILRLGVPSGIQSSLFAFSNVLIQSSINNFGDLYVAGNGAASQLDSFIYTTMNAFYTTTMAFTGQNFGAHKKQRIKRTLGYGLLLNTVVTLTMGLLMLIFADPLLRIFTSNEIALEAGRVRLQVMASTTFLCGAMDIFSAHLRGLGFSVVPMFTTLGGVCGLRVLLILTVIPLFGTNGTAWLLLFLLYPITWLITLCAHSIYTCFVDKRVYAMLTDRPENDVSTVEETTSPVEDYITVEDFADDSDEEDPLPTKA